HGNRNGAGVFGANQFGKERTGRAF
ncbi:putative D-serine dehydratase (Deaminase) transcriptional activator domain protein, partial [Vibrio parahaemolyticus V-223/04]